MGASLDCLDFAGVVLGIVYRVVTAGVIGANIGGGLLFWVGVPVGAFLIGRALNGIAARPAVEHEEPTTRP